LDILPGLDGDSKRGLEIHDIPMGGSNIGKPPLYRLNCDSFYALSIIDMLSSELASNEEAWQQARDVKGISSLSLFPIDDMVWATASTRDSTSWMHLEDHGMATAVTIRTGLKYWVLATHKQKQAKDDENGDLGSIGVFGDSWGPGSACETMWDHEGVLLAPGDVL
jgi:hypothetical protein